MNQSRGEGLNPETFALILTLLASCSRLTFEIYLVLETLGAAPPNDPEFWVQTGWSLIQRPLVWFQMLFTLPLTYLPLYLCSRSEGLLTAKERDLTKGSIAQDELT